MQQRADRRIRVFGNRCTPLELILYQFTHVCASADYIQEPGGVETRKNQCSLCVCSEPKVLETIINWLLYKHASTGLMISNSYSSLWWWTFSLMTTSDIRIINMMCHIFFVIGHYNEHFSVIFMHFCIVKILVFFCSSMRTCTYIVVCGNCYLLNRIIIV